jgi:hypothetical protein
MTAAIIAQGKIARKGAEPQGEFWRRQLQRYVSEPEDHRLKSYMGVRLSLFGCKRPLRRMLLRMAAERKRHC